MSKNNIKQKYDEIVFFEKCGCYSCRRIFSSQLIDTTIYDDSLEDDIAVCPFCEENTVVGDSENELTEEVLDEIKKEEEGSSYYKKVH